VGLRAGGAKQQVGPLQQQRAQARRIAARQLIEETA
jgi:hypothetical protein